jgi:hypothetical protein
MQVTEFVVRNGRGLESALRVSRVIDIYKGVYHSYTDDLARPTSREIASDREIILCFELLLPHVDSLKILNTLLKLLDLMNATTRDYCSTADFKAGQSIILEQLNKL